MDAIMAAVGLMVDSGLPCFGRGEPMKNLYNRFHMEKTDKQAAEFMRATIADAYDKVRHALPAVAAFPSDPHRLTLPTLHSAVDNTIL